MRTEKGNQFAEFSDWMGETVNGVQNGARYGLDMLEALQSAWRHGQEAGHHEGHVDGWNLAVSSEREACAKLVETRGAYTDWNEDAVALAAEIRERAT